MATCASCGKILPGYSYGAASDRCPECRRLQQQVAPGRVGIGGSEAPSPSYPVSRASDRFSRAIISAPRILITSPELPSDLARFPSTTPENGYFPVPGKNLLLD